MKLLSKYTKLACFVAVVTLTLSSCMPGPADNPSVVEVAVQVRSIASTLTTGNDSLHVNELRFIHGQSFFRTDADSTLILNRPTQLTLPNQRGGNILSILRPSPFPKNVYKGITFKVVRADSVKIEGDPPPRYSFDPDNIFTDGGNYSMVIDGTFNGEEFTLKIPQGFTYKLTFDIPVAVKSGTKSYLYLISTDIENWFAQPDSMGYLNPKDNKEAIIANIANDTTFTIEQISPEQ